MCRALLMLPGKMRRHVADIHLRMEMECDLIARGPCRVAFETETARRRGPGRGRGPRPDALRRAEAQGDGHHVSPLATSRPRSDEVLAAGATHGHARGLERGSGPELAAVQPFSVHVGRATRPAAGVGPFLVAMPNLHVSSVVPSSSGRPTDSGKFSTQRAPILDSIVSSMFTDFHSFSMVFHRFPSMSWP